MFNYGNYNSSSRDYKGKVDSSHIKNTGKRYSTSQIFDYETDSYITVKRPLTKDSFQKNCVNSNTYHRRSRSVGERRRARQRQQLKQRIACGLTAASVAIGGLAMGAYKFNAEPEKDLSEDISTQNIKNIEDNNVESSQVDDYQIVFPPKIEDENVQKSYNNIMKAISTFSDDLGENGLSLIKERVNAIGDGEVNVIDVLKILWIESNGRIYDDNGNIITSYTGEAFGPFQLTPSTVDYLNYYYGLEGTDAELDIMNPYDNLDACIYNIKFLKEKKLNDFSENGVFPSEVNNLMEAVFWCYHDGAWANKVTQQGADYIEKYRNLSVIDDYQEIVDYIVSSDTFVG